MRPASSPLAVLRLIALVSIAVAGGCSKPPEHDTIIWRLVDGSGGASTVELRDAKPALRGPARALIRDDQRYTFDRPKPQFLHRAQHFHLSDEERLSLDLPLPASLRGCDQLLAEVSLSHIEARDRGWVVANCTGAPITDHLAVEFPVEPVLRDHEVDLWVLTRPKPDAISARRFHVARMPPGTRLEVAYGVEEPAWRPDAAAVIFRIKAEGENSALFEKRVDAAGQPDQRRWYDATVDLARYSGKSLTLLFETALDPVPGRKPFSLPVWGNPTLFAPAAGDAPWGVLLISLDTLRARSLGAYGRERPTSPFFDALTRQGVLFDRAIAQAPSTPQSHMSLFTSLYPSTHGITDLKTASKMDAYVTLAEVLRREGYSTGAVTEDGLLQASLGFERGFDSYYENKSSDLEATVGQIESTFQRAGSWLEAHRNEPFFLFVHTYQVHDPYTPPPAYQDLFGEKHAKGIAADLDRYEEEVRYEDDQLAQLWSHVQALGLADRTLLIVTSDHGEEFGEHGTAQHGSALFDETLHVPLFVRAPGLVPAGMRVAEQVGLIDVAPTVLELLGIPPVTQAQGTSLVGLFQGGDARGRLAARLAERALYAEAWAPFRVLADGSIDHQWHAPVYSQRTRDLKLIWTPALAGKDRFQAYDLASDPLERHDISSSDDPLIASGRQTLERYAQSGAGATAAVAGEQVAPDPETMKKLRALGYVQ